MNFVESNDYEHPNPNRSYPSVFKTTRVQLDFGLSKYPLPHLFDTQAKTCILQIDSNTITSYQPVREAVSYRGLFTAGWFGVRKKHCSQLEIYDRLRASEQAVCL